jgi:hypothetical protein
MKKEILSEISRVKEIMGLNLLNEGVVDDFTSYVLRAFGPGADVAAVKSAADAAVTKLGRQFSVVATDLDRVMQGIVRFDSLSASQQKKIFELLTAIDEIRPALYKEVLGELGYSGSDGVKQFERALLDDMVEIQRQNPRLAPDTVYKKGLEKLGIDDEIFPLMSKTNQKSLLDALGGKTKFFDMGESELVKRKTDLFRKMEKNAQYDPTEQDFELMDELIRRNIFPRRDWNKFLERKFVNLKEVWGLAEDFMYLKGKGEIPGNKTFDEWVTESGKKYANVWAKYGKDLNSIIRIVSIPLFLSKATPAQRVFGWLKLGGITLGSGLLFIIERIRYGGKKAGEAFDDFTNYDVSKIEDRWKEFWAQSEPQFNIGGNKFSVYNELDLEKNKLYENNAPAIRIYDKEKALLEVPSGISVDGVVKTVVKFLMSKSLIAAGSRLFRDYISLPTISTTPTPEPQTTTYTKDIESFKDFLNSKNIDSSDAYYDIELDMFYDGKSGEYEFSEGSFL